LTDAPRQRINLPVTTRRLKLFGGFCLLSLLTRAAFVSIPILDLDEATHAVGSWELLRGGLLYRDFADNKPPLLYAYYALCQGLLGRGLPAVRLATAAVTLPLTALALCAFFDWDRRGAAAGALYIVYGAAFYAHDMQSVNAEVPMLLPGAWALVLLKREDHGRGAAFCAGLLLGFAFLVKYQIAFWLAAAPLALAWLGRWRRAAATAAALAAGFVLPLLAAWACFEAWGGGPELLDWTLRSNLVYLDNPIPLAEAARRAARSLLPFLAATLPLWWAWRRSAALFGARFLARFVDAWLLVSLPAAFLGLRFFPHYFIQLYPPLALGAAPWVSRALASPPAPAGRRFLLVTVAIFLGFTIANSYLYREAVDVYEETSPRVAEAAAWLHADRCVPNPTLFVWGYAPGLYYLSGVAPASRFVVPQSSLAGYVAGNTASATGTPASDRVRADHWNLLLGDLERRRATYVVDTAPSGLHHWDHFPLASFPPLARLVAEGYEPVATVKGIVIYRRRDCASDR